MGRGGNESSGSWLLGDLTRLRLRADDADIEFVRRNEVLIKLFHDGGSDAPQDVLARHRDKLLDWSEPSFCAFSFSSLLLSMGLGDIPQHEAIKLMRDGRMASRVIEVNLATHLGLRQPENSNEEWDLEGENGKSEVRCLTRYGLSFAPSNSKGKGRKFDESSFVEKVDTVDGFYVADVQNYPEVDLFSLGSDQVREWHDGGKLGKNAALGRSRARELLEDVLPPPEIEEVIAATERREGKRELEQLRADTEAAGEDFHINPEPEVVAPPSGLTVEL
jgi:hypothetical protein